MINIDFNHCGAFGPVAQWIRHRPTEPGIAGSSPAGVITLSRAWHCSLWFYSAPLITTRRGTCYGRHCVRPRLLADARREIALLDAPSRYTRASGHRAVERVCRVARSQPETASLRSAYFREDFFLTRRFWQSRHRSGPAGEFVADAWRQRPSSAAKFRR